MEDSHIMAYFFIFLGIVAMIIGLNIDKIIPDKKIKV